MHLHPDRMLPHPVDVVLFVKDLFPDRISIRCADCYNEIALRTEIHATPFLKLDTHPCRNIVGILRQESISIYRLRGVFVSYLLDREPV